MLSLVRVVSKNMKDFNCYWVVVAGAGLVGYLLEGPRVQAVDPAVGWLRCKIGGQLPGCRRQGET